MWKFNPEAYSTLPKYRQIIAAVINDLEKGILQKDEQLPSINELSFEYDIARDTVEKAYNELKENGIIISVRGKGFFVYGLQSSKIRILLILNKISAYKKLVYYSLLKTLGSKATVDLQVHHSNAVLCKKILDENKGKYHVYAIMPHFYEGTDEVNIKDVINNIPKDELVLLDKQFQGITGDYISVYQDFENDIYEALENANDRIGKYEKLFFVFPDGENYPQEIIKGFRKYSNHYKRNGVVLENTSKLQLSKGSLYIVIEEIDLVELVKEILQKGFLVGEDIGIISFNETTLKAILAGGITTISTHFESMGAMVATLILEKKYIKIKNPFSTVYRNSF